VQPNRPAVEPTRAIRPEPKREATVERKSPVQSAEPAPVATETASSTPVATPASPDTPVPSAAEPQAAAPEVSTTAPASPAPPVWKDGKYTAWGTCRHGDIQATVVIAGGRIISAAITDCQTRYACDVIENLPSKVVTRQKAKFDTVGGATESAYAYYGAVYWALDQASK
jgi:uncharacterized protein with FMN-binding domain